MTNSGPPVFDRHVLALDIACVLQALAKSAHAVHDRIRRLDVEESDYRRRPLLCPHIERPSGRRAAKRDNEFSPPDVDCHATLPWGSCNGEDDITPGRAALRDFKPAYVCWGSKVRITAAQQQRPVLVS
jgi:hypothetical protein